MARRQKESAEKPSIAREEWDFSTVPDYLVFDCWAYEYSREAMRLGTKLPEVVFDLLPDYRPNKSLPFLNRAGVKRIVEAVAKQKLKPAGKGKRKSKSWLEQQIFKRGYDLAVSAGPVKGHRSVLLSIDWEMETSALANDFKELIGRLRKNKKLKTRRGGREGQILRRLADLKRLGAMRILNAGFTADEAIGMTLTICGEELYKEESRWFSAKTAAQRVLAQWPAPISGDIFHPESPQPIALAKRLRKAARKGR